MSIMMSYTCAPCPMQLGSSNFHVSCVVSLEVRHIHELLVQSLMASCTIATFTGFVMLSGHFCYRLCTS